MSGSGEHVEGPWRYERVDGAGHWLQVDEPERINALLLGWLREVEERWSMHRAAT